MEPQASTGFSTDPVSNKSQIVSCKFNPSGNSVLATTPTGFAIYVIDKEGNATLQHEHDVGTELKFTERLYSTNLVAYATKKNPDIFVVFHCKRKKVVCDFRYPSEIQVIRFNRQRVIIGIKDMIYIHNVRNMQIVQLIKDVPEYTRNVMELASSENCGFLAFPWRGDTGSLRIYDVFALQDIACIQAHNNPLAIVKFDATGARIATASVKGTCIRVFDSAHGQKVYEFRRGFKDVQIASLSFSQDGTLLSATSDSDTIHIFKLTAENQLPADGSSGGILGNAERAFTTIANPLHGQQAIGYLGTLAQGSVNFMLVSPAGQLHVYQLDASNENGEVLKPLKQHNLAEVKTATPEQPEDADKGRVTPDLKREDAPADGQKTGKSRPTTPESTKRPTTPDTMKSNTAENLGNKRPTTPTSIERTPLNTAANNSHQRPVSPKPHSLKGTNAQESTSTERPKTPRRDPLDASHGQQPHTNQSSNGNRSSATASSQRSISPRPDGENAGRRAGSADVHRRQSTGAEGNRSRPQSPSPNRTVALDNRAQVIYEQRGERSVHASTEHKPLSGAPNQPGAPSAAAHADAVEQMRRMTTRNRSQSPGPRDQNKNQQKR